MPVLRLTALLAAYLLLLSSPALAASPVREIKDLAQPIAAGSPTTYADLLKLIFPAPIPGRDEPPQTPPVRSLDNYFEKQPLTAKPDAAMLGGMLALPI